MIAKPLKYTIAIVILAISFAGIRFLYDRKNTYDEGTSVRTAEVAAAAPAWRSDFDGMSPANSSLPQGWQLRSKPGTSPARFYITKDGASDSPFLRMEADRSSASLITALGNIDLKTSPIVRWRWRVKVLPEGADGSIPGRDDQAIGIYIGSGSAMSNKSVSYRWDTDTQKGSEGESSYMLGAAKIRWHTLRNKSDDGGWIIEERNIAEDFMKAWGYYPDRIYLSVSCNSQYTGTRAVADLDWIEFRSSPIK